MVEELSKEEIADFIQGRLNAAIFNADNNYALLRNLYEAACDYDKDSTLAFVPETGTFFVLPED